jgi:hypothetical protein
MIDIKELGPEHVGKWVTLMQQRHRFGDAEWSGSFGGSAHTKIWCKNGNYWRALHQIHILSFAVAQRALTKAFPLTPRDTEVPGV